MKRLILLAAVLAVGVAAAGWRGRFDEQFAAATATSTARLPAEYQEVEYLESTGTETQWIETGYTPTQSTTFEIKFKWKGANRFVFGGPAGTYGLQIFGVGYAKFHSMGHLTTLYFDIAMLDCKLTCVFKSGMLTISCEDTGQTFSSLAPSGGSGMPQLTMFGFAQQGHWVGNIYSCKFWESDTPVLDLVPAVRKSDSVAGMYDLVNGVFYTNQGTGEFIVGPNIED